MREIAAALLLGLLGVPRAEAEPRVLGTYPLSENPYGLSSPQAAAFDPIRRELWVAGYYSGNLVVIDSPAKKPVAVVEGLTSPTALAVDPARGRLYVVAQGTLHVIDMASRQRIPAPKLPLYYYPNKVGADRESGELYLFGWAYLSTDQSTWKSVQRLARYDAGSGAVVAKLDLPESHNGSRLAVSKSRVYLALNIFDSAASAFRSELWVIDKTSFTVLQKVGLGAQGISGLALDPAGETLYLADPTRLWKFRGASVGLVQVATAASPGGLWDLDLDPAAGRLYGADRYMNRVHGIDVSSLKSVKTYAAGQYPSALAVDPEQGLLMAANQGSNDVSIIDLKAGTAALVDLKRYEPQALALAPNSSLVLAACGLTGAVGFWDRQTLKLQRAIPEASGPSGLAYFPALEKAFLRAGPPAYGHIRKLHLDGRDVQSVADNRHNVAAILAYPEAGQLLALQSHLPEAFSQAGLTVFDAHSEFHLQTIPLGPHAESPRAAAVNAATGKAYVVLYATHQVQAVDLASGKSLKRLAAGLFPRAVAVNPNLNRIYVANYGSNSLTVIDGSSDEVVASVPVGAGPRAVAVKKRGARVYVANSLDGTVTVIDGRTLATVATLRSGGFPVDLQVEEAADRVYAANASSASITVLEDAATLDAKPPVIAHAPLAGPFPEDKPVAVEAQVSDEGGVAVVTLTYWEPGRRAFYTIPMPRVAGSLYRGEIPADFLMSLRQGRVAYFIDASDAEGNGPPTGSIPGSASVPNEFAVSKRLAPLWSHAFGKVYGGYYRMVPGPSPAIGEIRPDVAGLEVATGNEEYWPLGGPGPSGRWFLFSSTGGVVFWKNTENDEAHSSVNLFDLDGDGLPEMLGGTTSGNQMQAWDRFGRWVWRHILQSHHLGTPAADVLKTGGPARVFGGSFDKRLRALDGKDGTLLWSFTAPSWIWSSPAVADLDGDGSKEVVFACDTAAPGSPNLFALDAAAGTLRWQAALGGHVRASAALADMDADGVREVLIGAPDGVFRAFHGRTGALLWSFKTGGEIVSSAAVGDLDGDGKPEVVFGSADGRLYGLGAGGALRWSAALGSPVLGSPALARSASGKGLDVYVTAAVGVLHLVRGADGRRLAGLGAGAGVASSPSVGDVDGDGKLEIFFQDRFGDSTGAMSGDRFWAVRDLGSQAPAYAREWPLFRRDPAHTGVYPWQAAPTPAPVDTAAPVSKILLPADGSVLHVTTATVSGTAQDNMSGVAKVEVSLRDLAETAAPWHLAQGTATFSLALSGLKDFHGYQSCSRATDQAGNQEVPASCVKFSVDLPPGPVTGLLAGVGGAGTSATLTWDPAFLADLAGYRVYDAKGQLMATVSTNSHALSGLSLGTGYAYQVSIVDLAGQEGPKTTVSFTTPSTAACTARIKIPKDGKKLWGNAVTVMAEVTCPVQSVLFQFRYDDKGPWTDIAKPDSKKPYVVYWNVSDPRVSTGTYAVRAVATDAQGFLDLDPGQISVLIGDANADIVEDGNPDVDPNNEHKLTAKVAAGVSETIMTGDGTQVQIPAGALPAADTIEVFPLSSKNVPPPASGNALLKPANVFVELKFQSGLKKFAKPLVVTLPAPDADQDGLVDGTKIPVAALKAYYFDQDKKWLPVLAAAKAVGPTVAAAAASPPALNALSFETDHFTIFGLFEELPLKTHLAFGEVYAFPNPARGQSPTFHIEAGWADRVELRVYDAAGELAFRAETAGPPLAVDDGQGIEQAYEIRWDVAGVPGGTYRYVVVAHQAGAGSVTKSGKCSVIK